MSVPLASLVPIADEPAADPRGRTIKVRADALHLIADEAETSLVESDAPLFVRGTIVRPVVDRLPAAKGATAKVARLCEVGEYCLLDHLSRAANYLRFDVRKNGWVPTNPPKEVARIILAREGEWAFRRLAGVITTPTLRPDGSILAEPGYDADTQLLLLEPPPLPPMPERPGREDALEALETLERLLTEFPFASQASRSVAISAIVTLVVRGSHSNAPMHVATAPVAGSGKTFIFDIASAVGTGEPAPVMAAGRTEEETEKRLIGALLTGQSVITIDNVNGELGGDLLCQAIERPIVSLRALGSSKLFKVESRATFYATGNNIHLVGDMTRRVIVCSLDPNTERPELRKFKANPFDMAIADRGRFIAAALIICRAYALAGYPAQRPPLASFEGWSKSVRSALCWLGLADPVETMESARADDPNTTALRTLLRAWRDTLGEEYVTAAKALERGQSNYMGTRENPDLYHALHEVSDSKGTLSAKRLGRFLGSQRGRVLDGLKLVDAEDAHAKIKVWAVVDA